ncbi:unnamed protein product [Lymnaea stagnalis]|uniref:Uncharacterized protein n=1 Tax=Lymnaea stagnalis TaxID=6523 RepID=A0AAV2HEJ1_LYMST
MDIRWMFLWISGILLTSPTEQVFTIKEETRLRTDLFLDYDSAVRPDATTGVKLSFQPTAITSVDIKNQQFGISGWWLMRWTDSRLAWVRGNYSGIPIVQIKSDLLWTPCLVVDNSVDDLTAIDEDSIPLRVDSNGSVSWNPPGLLTVSCNMDITYFPWDSHTCAIQVTSFGYTIQELDIRVYGDGVVKTYFSPDGEWDVIDTWTERTIFTEDEYQYSKVSYNFKLTRRPLFYGLNYLLPVIISSFLTMFVFLLPADSGEKIGYCLTVLLGYMVILTLIATDLPTTAQYTSILELYIAVVLIMGGLSVILSIFVLEIFFRPDDLPIPNYVRKLTFFGMRLCCYEGCCARKVGPADQGGADVKDTVLNDMTSSSKDKDAMENYFSRLHDPLGSESSSLEKNHDFDRGMLVKSTWSREKSFMGLRPATVQSTREEQSRGLEITWKTVSMVLDGVLLRFYCLFLVVSSCVFLSILITNS